MESPIRVAVVGAGMFGRHHARVYRDLPHAELVGVYDANRERAAEVAAEFGCRVFASLAELEGAVVAASIAVPTDRHAEIGCTLMRTGIDVLIEKPMCCTADEADALVETAGSTRAVLQIGHLERFNPAVEAARSIATFPLFFEVHRMSIFTSRSLEVDVVLDLMIHDLDIVQSLVRSEPEEIRAVGLPVLSDRVDIANVRLTFENGCVANFTASRVSTEKIRKLRWFQPHEYVSVDYARQDAAVTSVDMSSGRPSLSYRKLNVPQDEPLRLEILDFLKNVRTRGTPQVGASEGRRALLLANRIVDEMEQHSRRVKMYDPAIAGRIDGDIRDAQDAVALAARGSRPRS